MKRIQKKEKEKFKVW